VVADFRSVPAALRPKTTAGDGAPDVGLCFRTRPRVDVYVDAEIAVLARVWLGDVPLAHALRAGTVKIGGDPRLARGFPGWLMLSTLAVVPRPAEQPQRRVA
jgi:hypothetical protein